MTIAETQLDTWAKQGPTQQFVDTYGSIRDVLTSSASTFHGRSFDVRLQGSYGNDTNVYGDSDVDIVVCTSDTIGYDLDQLPPEQKQLYLNSNRSVAQSACGPFREEVISRLRSYYGAASVIPGKKAILLQGSGSRRSADILVCTEHRQYYRYTALGDGSFHSGIRFFASDGTAIVNFPKQHAKNCTTKHQATSGWFKPTARIFKNMRNRMIDRRVIGDRVAPSYYIEGMLWNVPNVNFGTSYQSTIANCLNWIRNANEADLLCANELRWLVRDGRLDAWPTADFNTFVTQAIGFWNNGG